MEGLLTVSCLLVFATWLLVKFLRGFSEYRRSRNLCLKIPGPKPHWLIGNLDTIKSSVDYQNLVSKLTKDGAKLYCIWSGPFPVVGVTHPTTAKEILRTSSPKPNRICDAYRMLFPYLGNGLLLSSGRLWEQNRRLLTPGFHFEILKDYVPVYNDVADILLKNIAEAAKSGESVEIFDPISKATLDTILRCTLSTVENYQQTGDTIHPHVETTRKIAHLIWERLLYFPHLFDFIYYRSKSGKLFLKLVKFCQDFSKNKIAARKEALQSGTTERHKKHLDFLDILLSARTEDGEPLDDTVIRNEVDTILFGAHESTASAISFVLYNLAKRPDDQQIVYEEIAEVLKDSADVKRSHLPEFNYLTCFIKESMRYYSPIPLIARQTTQEIELDGVTVPEGVRVDINLQAIHHHPDVWQNPEEFDMRRFDKSDTKYKDREMDPFAFVPFSAGPRNCLGQNFAMNEIKCIVAKFLLRFKVREDPSHTFDLVPDIVTRSNTGIKVYFEPRG